MIIRGIELDFDVYDADQGPTYTEHAEKIRELTKAMSGNRSTDPQDLREAITSMCEATGDMLDDVFGEGTREKIFKGRKSLNVAIECFECMNAEVAAQKDAMEARTSKYSQNRAQRRASAK